MDRPLVTTQSMIPPLSTKAVLRALSGALALWWLAPQAALAQGHLDAQYEATLAGIPVGKGAWTIDIGDEQFSAAASGDLLPHRALSLGRNHCAFVYRHER